MIVMVAHSIEIIFDFFMKCVLNFSKMYHTISEQVQELNNPIKEITRSFKLDVSKIKFVSKSTVNEDNQGSIKVNNSSTMTPK